MHPPISPLVLAALVASLGMAAACGSGPAEPPPSGKRISVVARPVADDTVQAAPIQPIVVEVRRPDGGLAAGTVVRFTPLLADTVPGQLSMLVRESATLPFAGAVSTAADARGRASALVQFWIIAGPGRIEVTVPEFGAADTVQFTVRPGAISTLGLLPRDTALGLGVTVQLRSRPRDRLGNGRADAVAFAAASMPVGAAAVTTSGAVSATAPGRVRVIGQVGGVADTTFVSVVPAGRFWAVDAPNGGLSEHTLEGALVRRVTISGNTGLVEPALAPNGREFAIAPVATPGRIDLVSTTGAVSRIDLTPGSPEPYWPAYSPDGSTIYFAGVVNSDPTGIWRINRNGTGLARVTSGLHFRPKVSPDGRYLTLHSFEGELTVRVFDLLTSQFLPGSQPGKFPEWSPRGGLAYLTNDGGILMSAPADLAQTRAITLGEIRLFPGPLSWSPDGGWILGRCLNWPCLVDLRTGEVMPLTQFESLGPALWSLPETP